MARTVTFYKMTLDKRYLDKTAGLKNPSTINSAHFIDDTEIVNPTMKLSDFDEDQCNYVYIPSLRRYYYVTGVTYSRGYYFISLHVDVLMSFKDSIMSQETILSRCSDYKYYNLYQSDDKFQLYEYTNIRYKFFKGGQTFSPNIQNFVLCVMGGDEIESEE